MVGMAAVATKIAPWGNSEAVRIPRSILRIAGLATGDSVDVTVNERNNIELVRIGAEHRRIRPTAGITFDSLFAGYKPTDKPMPAAWPNDDMVGAEFEAWAK